MMGLSSRAQNSKGVSSHPFALALSKGSWLDTKTSTSSARTECDSSISFKAPLNRGCMPIRAFINKSLNFIIAPTEAPFNEKSHTSNVRAVA
jgi:hypothetical protein